MKHVLIALAAMLLLLPASALGDDYGWQDGIYTIGDTGYALVLPEDVLPEKPDGNVLVSAVTDGFDGTKGACISVELTKDATLDEQVEEVYQQLVSTPKKQGMQVIEASTADSETMLMMTQASGNPCAYVGRRQISIGEGTFPCCYEEIYTRSSGSSAASLVIVLFIPAEEGIYNVAYVLASDYVDGIENVILGTVDTL